MILDFFKETYFHELEFREKIIARSQFASATNIAVFTGVIFMMRRIDYGASKTELIVFHLLVFIGALLILLSVFCSAQALTGYQYKLIVPEDGFNHFRNIFEHTNALREHNFANPNKVDIYSIDEEVSDYILPEMIACTRENREINKKRAEWNRNSIGSTIFSLIPLFLASVVFVYFDLDVASPRKNQGIEDKSIENSLHSIDEQLKKYRYSLTSAIPNILSPQETLSHEQRHQSAGTLTGVVPAPAPAKTSTASAKPNRNCHRKSER